MQSKAGLSTTWPGIQAICMQFDLFKPYPWGLDQRELFSVVHLFFQCLPQINNTNGFSAFSLQVNRNKLPCPPKPRSGISLVVDYAIGQIGDDGQGTSWQNWSETRWGFLFLCHYTERSQAAQEMMHFSPLTHSNQGTAHGTEAFFLFYSSRLLSQEPFPCATTVSSDKLQH